MVLVSHQLDLKDALEELTQVFGIDPVFQQHQKDEEQKRLNRQKRWRKPNDAGSTTTAFGPAPTSASAPRSKNEPKPPRKSRVDTIKQQNPAKNPANQEIANEFVDLGGYELTHGETQKGISRMRAAKQIRSAPEPIKSGAQARQIPGIGPSAAAKVDEVLQHGKMRVLEDIESSQEDKDVVDDV